VLPLIASGVAYKSKKNKCTVVRGCNRVASTNGAI
jgi:hypothetical protein